MRVNGAAGGKNLSVGGGGDEIVHHVRAHVGTVARIEEDLRFYRPGERSTYLAKGNIQK
jgi:hypothetical protein